MKIVTWNINGVQRPARQSSRIGCARALPTSSACRRSSRVDEQFPRAEIEALGYNVETHGQKGFNGVALLSKLPFDEVKRGLPGDPEDEQARFIEGVFSTDKGALRVASLYLPNGNPVDDDKKFPYKLAWMERLEQLGGEPPRARGAAGAGRRLQRHPRAGRRTLSRELGQRRAVPAADPAGFPPARQSRLHRCRPLRHRLRR